MAPDRSVRPTEIWGKNMDDAVLLAHLTRLTSLLYHFCRLQLPRVELSAGAFERHLKRTFEMYRAKQTGQGVLNWEKFLEDLHAVDWFLCCACLEGIPGAWDVLFAARVSRADRLLVDALRARAVRLYPRDEERQDSAVAGFWGYLLAGDRPGSLPVLARYDGQRPLLPWLIRVFQNKQISDLRQAKGMLRLPDDDDLDTRDLLVAEGDEGRWHEEFRQAASDWLAQLGDAELLILGLRMRYRLSQRQVAALLGIHEGNVSRHTAKFREQYLEQVSQKLMEAGWTGDDLSGFIQKEMDSLLMDEPRLSADRLAALLAARGKSLPPDHRFHEEQCKG